MAEVVGFLRAAAPLVLAGIALAVICAGIGEKRSKSQEERIEQYIALGAGVGLMISLLLSNAHVIDDSFSLTVGPLWGMATATVCGNLRNKKRRKDAKQHDGL